METPSINEIAKGKQAKFRKSWSKLLRNTIPEQIYLESVPCKLLVRRCILEYEQVLIASRRGFWAVPQVEEEAFIVQLKYNIVQNALYDLAIITLDVERYETIILDKVRSYMERLVGLAGVENLRGKGFVQEYFHFPVPTSIRMSIQQKIQLLKHLWEDPLDFCQSGLTYLLKLRESNKLEREIHLKFRGGYKMQQEEVMEERLNQYIWKMQMKFKQINRSLSRDPLLRLPDLVGRMRFYITNDVALPVLQRCKRKMTYSRNTRKDIQNRWRALDESSMSPGEKAKTKEIGFVDILWTFIFLSGSIESLPPAIYCAVCSGKVHFGYDDSDNENGSVCAAEERVCGNFYWEFFRVSFLLALFYYMAKGTIKFIRSLPKNKKAETKGVE